VAGEAGRQRRDWLVDVGIGVAGASAAVASFAGLRSLAIVAGWPSLLAALLPVTVDVFAATSTRVWLAASTVSPRARRFARSNAVAGLVLSLVGNATYHLIAAGLVAVNWVVVVVVGAIPAAVLFLIAHMAALRNHADQPPSTEVVPRTGAEDEGRPKFQDADELLEAARLADVQYRQSHDGRPISRDALRAALRVSVRRATEVRRLLKESQVTKEAASR
jgi:hypothetical protein